MDHAGRTALPSSHRRSRVKAARGPTRISWTWLMLVVAVLLGIALVDFLVQNRRVVRIEFFSVSGRVPIAVALLAAAIVGAAVVMVVAVARMGQLRRGLRPDGAGGRDGRGDSGDRVVHVADQEATTDAR
jgi:uncharacterized integral membrane protein